MSSWHDQGLLSDDAHLGLRQVVTRKREGDVQQNAPLLGNSPGRTQANQGIALFHPSPRRSNLLSSPLAAEAFLLSPMAGELHREIFSGDHHSLQQGAEAITRSLDWTGLSFKGNSLVHKTQMRLQSDAAVKDFLAASPVKQIAGCSTVPRLPAPYVGAGIYLGSGPVAGGPSGTSGAPMIPVLLPMNDKIWGGANGVNALALDGSGQDWMDIGAADPLSSFRKSSLKGDKTTYGRGASRSRAMEEEGGAIHGVGFWGEEQHYGSAGRPSSRSRHQSRQDQSDSDEDSQPNRKRGSHVISDSGIASLIGTKHCNCKKSQCLKLYCDCFAAQQPCSNCSCVGCMNTIEHESLVREKRSQIKSRDPLAFERKIQGGDITQAQHKKGCNCKRSYCLKKYCECFQGGVSCGESCKCVDCKNCGDGGAGRGGGSDGDMTATKPPRSSMTKAQRRVHHDSAQAVSVPALDLMREEHEMAKPGDMGRSSKKQQRRAVSDPHKRRSASTADDEEEQAVACPGGWADEMDPSCVVSAFPHDASPFLSQEQMELLKSNQLAQLLKPPSGEDCNGVTPTAAIQGIDFANLQFEGVASVLGGGKGLAEAKNLPSVPSGFDPQQNLWGQQSDIPGSAAALADAAAMFSFNTPLADNGDHGYFASGAIPGIDGQAQAYGSVASLLASPPALGAAALQAAGLPPTSSSFSGMSPRSTGQGHMGDHLSHFKPFASPEVMKQRGTIGGLPSPSSHHVAPLGVHPMGGSAKGLWPLLQMLSQNSDPCLKIGGGGCEGDGGCASSQVTVKQEHALAAVNFSTCSPSSAASMLLKVEGGGSPLDGVHCLVTPVRTQQQQQVPRQQQQRQPSQGHVVKIASKRTIKPEGDAIPVLMLGDQEKDGAAASPLNSSDVGGGGRGGASMEGFGSFICQPSSSPPSWHRGDRLLPAAEPVGHQQDAGTSTRQYTNSLVAQQQQQSSLTKQEAYSYMLNRQRISFPGEDATVQQHLQQPAPSRSVSAPPHSSQPDPSASFPQPLQGLMPYDLCGIDATTPLYNGDMLQPKSALNLSPGMRSGSRSGGLALNSQPSFPLPQPGSGVNRRMIGPGVTTLVPSPGRVQQQGGVGGAGDKCLWLTSNSGGGPSSPSSCVAVQSW